MKPGENKRIMGLKYILKREDIMTFVAGLHELQEEMLEELVRRKEAEGFPEVQEVLKAVKRRL